jgi:hypothetical protein
MSWLTGMGLVLKWLFTGKIKNFHDTRVDFFFNYFSKIKQKIKNLFKIKKIKKIIF